MKLVLHIGTQKTGSTSIQKFLEINRDNLKQKKFYVNSVCLSENHIEFAARFNTFEKMKGGEFFKLKNINSRFSFEEWKKAFDYQILKDLGRASKLGCEYYLVSSEYFSTSSTSKSVKELEGWVKKYFDQIHVILFFREQVSLCESWYSTKLRQGFSGSLTDYARSIDPNTQVYDTNGLALLYEDSFGLNAVKLIPYDATKKSNSVEKFIGALGIADLDYTFEATNEKSNLNLSLLGQGLLAYWNKLNPVQDSFNANWVRRKILISKLEQNYRGEPERLNLIEAKRIKLFFADSNNDLFLRHGLNINILKSLHERTNTQIFYELDKTDFYAHFQKLNRNSLFSKGIEILFSIESKIYLHLVRVLNSQQIRKLKRLKSFLK